MKASITDNLINFLVNKKSFAIGYPGAAAKIVHATDYLLTSCLGSTLKLIAIIDCDRHPSKRAIFSKDELKDLKVMLKQFAYDAYSKRLGVSIEIWYVGQNASLVLQEPAVQINIKEYNFWVSSWAFDVQSKKVTCNGLSIRNFLRKRLLASVFKDIIRNHSIAIKNFPTNSFSLHPELV